MRNHTRCTCSVFSLLNMTSADEEGHLPQEDGQLSEEEGQILQGEDQQLKDSQQIVSCSFLFQRSECDSVTQFCPQRINTANN